MSLRQTKEMPKTHWEKVFRLGGLSVLVFRPSTVFLGHMNQEIVFAAAAARRNGSWLYLCEPPLAVNRTPFDFEIPNARRVPSIARLDWLFNWVADRAEKSNARNHIRRRRRLGLPLDSWLLESEYRARVRIGVWRLWLSERWLALLLLVATRGRRSRGRRFLLVNRFTKRLFKMKTIEEIRIRRSDAKRRFKENFVKSSVRNPPDYKSFLTWPVYELKWLGRLPLEKLTVDGQGTAYFKRRLIAENEPFRFRDADRDRLEALLCDVGIPAGAKLVTLHVRESGFKRGREIQDKAKARGFGADRSRDDSTRNATIGNCFAAIRYLTDSGYTIVRIGDPSMTPLSLPSVVDIATLPRRDPALDYYCVARSDFFIACDSGPMTISWMMGTPMLTLNVTHAVPVWPINKRGLVVPKYVRETATGRFLTLRQTCERPHIDHFRQITFYDYVELTPQDILTAVQEMKERVDAPGEPNPTILQEKYHDMYLDMTSNLENKYFRKWGPDDGFLGNGAIAQFVVERDAATGWRPLTDPTSNYAAVEKIPSIQQCPPVQQHCSQRLG
jgi:putative glycosyltransferase (TIGR04372 family)